MMSDTQQTAQVVKRHLNAFVLDLGIDAILADYDEHAVFITPDSIYQGREEIRHFFERFIASLPDNARKHFKLLCNKSRDDLAYITWSVADQVPLGTDTFVVRNRKIIQQTFAMYAD